MIRKYTASQHEEDRILNMIPESVREAVKAGIAEDKITGRVIREEPRQVPLLRLVACLLVLALTGCPVLVGSELVPLPSLPAPSGWRDWPHTHCQGRYEVCRGGGMCCATCGGECPPGCWSEPDGTVKCGS